MSELQLLFLVLALLYLWECGWWIFPGTVVFTILFGKGRAKTPGRIFGNNSGGFVLSLRHRLGGAAVLASSFPMALSPDGILPVDRNSPSGEASPGLLAWDKIKKIHARKKRILADDKELARANSPEAAAELAGELAELIPLAPGARENAVKKLIRARFDLPEMQARFTEYQVWENRLAWPINILLLVCFGVAPMIFYRFGIERTWPYLLGALFGLTLATGFMVSRAHRALYPERKDERFTVSILCALSPVNALCALDVLSRPLLEWFHPIILARAFLEPGRALPVYREQWRDFAFAKPPDTSESSAEKRCFDFFHTEMRKYFLKVFRDGSVTETDLTRPAGPLDPNCHAYCPRCQSQFIQKEGLCPDCGTVPLIPIPSEKAK